MPIYITKYKRTKYSKSRQYVFPYVAANNRNIVYTLWTTAQTSPNIINTKYNARYTQKTAMRT